MPTLSPCPQISFLLSTHILTSFSVLKFSFLMTPVRLESQWSHFNLISFYKSSIFHLEVQGVKAYITWFFGVCYLGENLKGCSWFQRVQFKVSWLEHYGGTCLWQRKIIIPWWTGKEGIQSHQWCTFSSKVLLTQVSMVSYSSTTQCKQNVQNISLCEAFHIQTIVSLKMQLTFKIAHSFFWVSEETLDLSY